MPTQTITDTTLFDIRQDPWAFHDKIVRVRGTFNECLSYACDFCPTFEAQFLDFDEYHAAGCMGVDFATDIGENLEHADDGRSRVADSSLGFLKEQEARFTTSTLIARYDAGCAGVQDPNDLDVIRICSDRASELEDAKIERVHVRRTGATGAITSYGVELISEIKGDDREHMLQAFAKQVEPLSENRAYFAYLEDDEYIRQTLADGEKSGGICQCRTKDCRADEWPKQVAGIWNITPANPYYCWPAHYDGNQWQFSTGEIF